MSSRQVVVSSSNAARLTEAAKSLASLPGATEILVLGATYGSADDLVRSAATRRGSLYGVHRMTIIQLAATLATEAMSLRKLAPLSRLGLEALSSRSVFHCRQERRLEYFDPVAESPGFPRALAATLSELRLEGVRPEALAAAGLPGADLARLLATYESELEARWLADLALMLRLATDAAAARGHRLCGLPLFLIDLSADSAAERLFLKTLAEASPTVVATALDADTEGVSVLEGILGAKATRLPPESEDQVHAPAQTHSLDRLRRHIFETLPPPFRELDFSVDFFSAPGEGLECVAIARRVLAAAEQGTPFDHVAVLLRDPDAYVPLLEDAMRRAGVPIYCTEGTVRPNPGGRAFLALLDCAEEGVSATRFAEYLSLGQVPELKPSGEPPEPTGLWVGSQDEMQSPGRAASASAALPGSLARSGPDGSPPLTPITAESSAAGGTLRTPFAWEDLLIDAAVIGGKDRWSRRLEGLRHQFEVQLQQLEPDETARRKYFEKQLDRLGNLERFAIPVIDLLDSLPLSATWGEWLSRLRTLAETTLRDPTAVLAVLSEFEPIEEIGPTQLPEVRRALAERLGLLREKPSSRRYGRVFVGTIDDSKGRSFDIVFVPGLAEGLFPRKPSEDPLLLDAYRRQLNDKLGTTLQTQDQRRRRERLLMQGAAGAARTRLSVSYPRLDLMEGRERVPSFYALEVLRAAEGRLPSLSEIRKRFTDAFPAALGWPAPRDPERAIDDAEHDLAVLARLISKPSHEARGGARYLLGLNNCLARSLRARAARWRKNAWTAADGLVDPDPATLLELATQRIAARSYSASSLQQFAACPYRFLLYAILDLEEREDAQPIEKIDPLTRGALFHEVQFETFRDLARAGFLPVCDSNLAAAMDTADQAMNRVAARYEEDLAPAIPPVWRGEMEDLRTDLRGWVKQLPSIHAEWKPIHWEYAFGLPHGPARDTERDPDSSDRPVAIQDGATARGSIDLVEEHRLRDALRITDHKTGRVPDRAPSSIGEGEILQPVLYGLAAEKLLGKRVESGVLYYCTQRGNYQQITIDLNEPSRNRLRLVMQTIDKAIAEGFLPAAPRKDACKYCTYAIVCGPYEERRVTRKPQERLADLDQLRCQP